MELEQRFGEKFVKSSGKGSGNDWGKCLGKGLDKVRVVFEEWFGKEFSEVFWIGLEYSSGKDWA